MLDPLKDIIRAHIKSQGPISIASYMEYCLLHPKYGYYTTQDSIGKSGDFTTAPEISQCFGEMVGVWALDLIKQLLGQTDHAVVSLVELGPGRGILMQDVLKTLQRFIEPQYLNIIMVEASPKLQQSQQSMLDNTGYDITWVENIDQLPAHPTLFIANEFFDALPIHQYYFDGHSWRERLIGLDNKNGLQFGLGAPIKAMDAVMSLKRSQGIEFTDGSIFEDSPISSSFMDRIAAHIETYKGAALIIDYGYSQAEIGDTFQAMSNHHYSDPLQSPGKADLTAHVDFQALGSQVMGRDIALYPTLTQSDFLMAHGIMQRAQQLAQKNPEKETDILTAVQRLCDEAQMGQLFKVLQITSKELLPQIFDNS